MNSYIDLLCSQHRKGFVEAKKRNIKLLALRAAEEGLIKYHRRIFTASALCFTSTISKLQHRWLVDDKMSGVRLFLLIRDKKQKLPLKKCCYIIVLTWSATITKTM